MPSRTVLATKLNVPPTPTAKVATNEDCDNFYASWSTVDNAESYEIDVATDIDFTTFVTGFQELILGNITAVAITRLVAGTTYFYRVRSVNSCSESTSSNVVTATTSTIPIPPVATEATNKGCTSFSANWNAVIGATSYEIDVAS